MKRMKREQRGYFLVIAVLFILAMGLVGTMVSYLTSNRAALSVAQSNGLKAFYNAESGVEIGTRLLTMPKLTGTPLRSSCASITGTSAITNASLGGGTFTITTINSSPIYSVDNLSAAVTSTATTIPVASTSGFAPAGRIAVDKEFMDYAAISGNSFIGVTRGTGGTSASSHASGAGAGQYQCSLDVQAGIPTIASPKYQRELQWNVQLQEGWAVGNVSGSNFVLTHWNKPTEKSWTLSTLAGGSNATTLNGLGMLSNADAWAVGNVVGSNFIFLRWNGSTWSLNTVSGACSGQNLVDVSMVSSQEGWAVGVRYKPTSCSSGNNRYTILRWNGSNWTLLTPSTGLPADNNSNQNLNAVHVIDTTGDGTGNIGFAVGNNGQILRYNGSTWTSMSSPTTQNLNGVYVVSDSEAWAVGAAGVIIKWNGTSWSSASSATAALNNVSMLDTNGDGLADAGFAVGNSQVIASYNGSSWSSVDLGGTNLLGVKIIDANDAWAVGASGLVLHW
ncbi:MAG: hypothetical protein EPO11_06570, partial [Gammaproteobacteria bacterium]